MLLAVFLVIAALFVVLGIIFALGKGANLIAGYNTASYEEKSKTDEKKLLKCKEKKIRLIRIYDCCLRKVNPDIEVIGDYVKSNIKIKVKCKICGHEWEAKPNNLTQGSGCPICRRKQATEKRKMTMENKKGFQ